jgi:hypothetical protein
LYQHLPRRWIFQVPTTAFWSWWKIFRIYIDDLLDSVVFFSLDLNLEDLSSNLADWYYDTGAGIYLSTTTMQYYRSLQDQIKKSIDDSAGIEDNEPPIDNLDKIKNLGSDLRTNLLKDIGTREESKFSINGSGTGTRRYHKEGILNYPTKV